MERMNLIRNFPNPYLSEGGSGEGIFTKGFGSCSTGGGTRGGFTLLQGHIQLMAMVPHLPENQLSPRWKTTSDTTNNVSQSKERESTSRKGTKLTHVSPLPPHPITPMLMPSASRYLHPVLPTVLEKVSSRRPGSNMPKPPRSRTDSDVSLPPKPSHPVTMPSFASSLPGIKKPSVFPPIPHQPSFQKADVPTSKKAEPQRATPPTPPIPHVNINTGHYVNPTSWINPQMAYQFMNQLVPPQQPVPAPPPPPPPQPSQQTFYHSGPPPGGTPHPMFPFLFSPSQYAFQQPPLPQCYENPYSYQMHSPRGMFYPPLHMCPPSSYPYPPPFAAQSLPCFPNPCVAPPHQTCSLQNFPSRPAPPPNQPVNNPNPIVLPPMPAEKSSRPVNTASMSMPSVLLRSSPAYEKDVPAPKSKEASSSVSVPSKTKAENSGSKNAFTEGNKKEESILVEDSSSDDDSKSSKKLPSPKESQHKITLPPLSSKPKIIACGSPSYTKFGPESNPGKLPCNPRVTHTPICGLIVNPRRDSPPAAESREEDDNGSHADTTNSTCNFNNSHCSHCNCCTNTMTWEEESRRREPPPVKFHSPRKKPKPVVVAVSECFPSDSSISEEEEEIYNPPMKATHALSRCSNAISGRKDSSLQNAPPIPGMPPGVIKKRKPTLENILYKPRLRGETEEVFEVLHDLSPDEVRLYSCEYLTELLSSNDWANCHIGLQTMVRMARHRPKTLLSYLGPILWYAFKHLTSAKSALCRAAIVTFKELFQRIGSALDNDLEKLTEKLVIKSLAPNRFIREECYRALEAMVNHCTLIKVLTAMEIVSKKNHVRAAMHRIARMTKQFVQVAGVDTCLKSMYAEKLLPMLFCFMTEANNETRVAAKEALAMLMNHLQFEKAVTKHVTFDRNCTEVFKKLDKMRGRNRHRGPIAATKAYNSVAQFKKSTQNPHHLNRDLTACYQYI